MNWVYAVLACAWVIFLTLWVRSLVVSAKERADAAKRRLDNIERKADHADKATGLLLVDSPHWERSASLGDVGEVRKELKELADVFGYEWGSPDAPWRGWRKKGKRK